MIKIQNAALLRTHIRQMQARLQWIIDHPGVVYRNDGGLKPWAYQHLDGFPRVADTLVEAVDGARASRKAPRRR